MTIYQRVRGSKVIGFIRRLFKIEIRTPENEPEKAGFIICANHSSLWDPIIMGATLKNPIKYMAKAELFKIPLLKQLITAFGAFPVNRKSNDLSSIKNTIKILEGGDNVGIYPQGHRVRYVNPSSSPIKSGAAMIAYRAKCGILPVTIYTKKMKVKLFRKTVVIIHPYVPYEELDIGNGNHEAFRRASEYVFRVICAPYNEQEKIDENA